MAQYDYGQTARDFLTACAVRRRAGILSDFQAAQAQYLRLPESIYLLTWEDCYTVAQRARRNLMIARLGA
ncbi:MAG: hypothetical protein IT318_20230 [Anaerolineales bacterium]|nr:hypothetical protein [Anaerolineales bacterium]